MAAPNTLCMPRVARLLLLLPNNYELGVHTQPSCTSLLYLRLHSPLYVRGKEISAGASAKFTSGHDDEREKERERDTCFILKETAGVNRKMRYVCLHRRWFLSASKLFFSVTDSFSATVFLSSPPFPLGLSFSSHRGLRYTYPGSLYPTAFLLRPGGRRRP